MTWIKIDDQLHSHPKVIAAWHAHHAALGLHLLALSHAACYLTDGRVSDAFVRGLLPAAAERRRVLSALTAVAPPFTSGLWVPDGSGWQIHDYLDLNESREDVLAKRAEVAEERAQAGRRGAAKRWQTDGKRDGKRDGKPMAKVPGTNGKPMAPGVYGKQIAPSPSPSPSP